MFRRALHLFLGVVVAAAMGSRAAAIENMVLAARDTVGYVAPTVGNGHTGIVCDLTGLRPQRVFQASVFDGGVPGRVSTIREAIVPLSVEIIQSNPDSSISDWTQQLDLLHGAVSTTYTVGDLQVTTSLRALRQMPHVAMMELTLKAMRPTSVTVRNTPRIPASMTGGVVAPSNIWCDDGGMRLVRADARYDSDRMAISVASTLVPDNGEWSRNVNDNSLSIELKPGCAASLWAVAAECSDADFADPAGEADRQVIYAARQGRENLLAEHERRWDELWRGRIEIVGDDELQRQANSALYNLYSSLRQDSRRSIAPMGLTSGKYYGHTFWDADTWILPVMAVLSPELARSMVDYRVDALPAARKRARAYGYKGAMFPWESDNRGEESTPTFALTGPLEHHVTADVARGAWQYFCASRDTAWLISDGFPLIRDCAEFITSRMSELSPGSGRQTMKNVVGADEYAIGVDADAFTDGACLRALEHATAAAEIVGARANPQWAAVASAIEFERFEGSAVIREHSTYANEPTKQADVELLAYPLGLLTEPADIRANIEHYAALIDSVGGPAMSHSAMAVNYARMGQPAQASRLIDRAYRPNLRGAFCALSETPGNNETYFMTAAGGLLQAIIFGYGGLEITPAGIVEVPSSRPAHISRLRVLTPGRVYGQ